MNTFTEQVGLRIRAAREKRGWSQSQLAAELGDRTQTAVSYWESGHREPGLQDIVRLCGLLGVPVGQLLCGGQPVDHRDRAAADALHHRRLSERAWACHDYHTAIYQRGVADGLEAVSMYGMPGCGPETTGSATGAPAPARTAYAGDSNP